MGKEVIGEEELRGRCRNVLEACIGPDQLSAVDEAVVKYITNILQAQTDLSTLGKPKEVQMTLASFLKAAGCATDLEGGAEKAGKLYDRMREEKLLVEVDPEETNELNKAVQLGRAYEKAQKDNKKISANTAGGDLPDTQNMWNDDLDWEGKRKQAKMERKRKKDEEVKDKVNAEYEAYLAKRGISKSEKAVKIHQGKGENRGMEEIRSTDIHINMGNQVLLDKTDLIIHPAHRYGLVGRNGVGKTTLLRYLAEGELEGVSPSMQILHIEQEFHGTDRTALQAILDVDVERSKLMQEEKDLLENDEATGMEVGSRLAEIYERMEEIDAHGAESRASSILAGLSFTQEMMNSSTKSFSGGWRMRIALARALFIFPDVLLLDEPTNHLDLHAVLWLEHTLRNWPKTLIVVSHSRSFLNGMATDIIHYHSQKLTYYKGNYDMFDQTRHEVMKNQARAHESSERKRQHMQAFVDRWRYNASKSTLAQSRLKALEKMEFIPAVEEDPSFKFTFPEPEPCAPPYIQVMDLTFGFKAGNVLFNDVNLGLDNDSRMALVGDNGSGKTTFLNCLLGNLNPIEGRVVTNSKCRIAHFSQHHVDLLTLQMTGIEFMLSKFPNSDPSSIRSQLGRFGLSGDKQLQPIYTLSGGQKSRIAFAYITFRQPHLLLLDEPTNHLDIDTVEALIDALHTYTGGVLLISHDEHLINSVCDELWVCGSGALTKFEGNFSDYKKSVIKKMLH